MRNKQIWSWTAGFLIASIAVSICSATVRAGQDTAVSVSGNDELNLSVSTGDAKSEESMSPDDGTPDLTSSDVEPAWIISLQVPDNLDFVIDPWNMSGRGQIYSERFTIKNCGDEACSLFLQGMASAPLNSVLFVEDVGEIYTQDTANVYLETVFENGDTLILSTEGREYTVTLEPGCELVFWLAGAVNEKASGNWGDKAVSVILRYSVF